MGRRNRRGFFRENGLSLTYLCLVVACLGGLSAAGFRAYTSEREEHGQKEITFRRYLLSPHFWQALAENWESEFLEMGTYVLFTSFLFQKGSVESNNPRHKKAKDDDKDRSTPPG